MHKRTCSCILRHIIVCSMHVQCIFYSNFLHMICIFLHILCILMHIHSIFIACLMHILCIWFSYLCILVAYWLHISCIFSAHKLHISCIFVHISHICCIFAYLTPSSHNAGLNVSFSINATSWTISSLPTS